MPPVVIAGRPRRTICRSKFLNGGVACRGPQFMTACNLRAFASPYHTSLRHFVQGWFFGTGLALGFRMRPLSVISTLASG
jgi:hypothetical protein